MCIITIVTDVNPQDITCTVWIHHCLFLKLVSDRRGDFSLLKQIHHLLENQRWNDCSQHMIMDEFSLIYHDNDLLLGCSLHQNIYFTNLSVSLLNVTLLTHSYWSCCCVFHRGHTHTPIRFPWQAAVNRVVGRSSCLQIWTEMEILRSCWGLTRQLWTGPPSVCCVIEFHAWASPLKSSTKAVIWKESY